MTRGLYCIQMHLTECLATWKFLSASDCYSSVISTRLHSSCHPNLTTYKEQSFPLTKENIEKRLLSVSSFWRVNSFAFMHIPHQSKTVKSCNHMKVYGSRCWRRIHCVFSACFSWEVVDFKQLCKQLKQLLLECSSWSEASRCVMYPWMIFQDARSA
jgi:hypothetical protein